MAKKETEENKLKEMNDELTKDIQRLQAEFDNYRRREDANKKSFLENATQKLIEKVIPVLDNFELAINSTSQGPAKQGMEMIYSQLISVLQEEGLEKIDPINEEFNPQIHEAIMVESGEDNKIIEVFQKGYKLNDRIIRHAKVKTRRQQNPQDDEAEKNGGNKNE